MKVFFLVWCFRYAFLLPNYCFYDILIIVIDKYSFLFSWKVGRTTSYIIIKIKKEMLIYYYRKNKEQ